MSFDLLPPGLSSSQDSDMGDEELVKIIEESESENTRTNTNWGWKKLIKWLQKRNIEVEFKTVTEENLNAILRKFYAEVKSEKKEPLTPSSLTGIRAAVRRVLISNPYSRSFDIIGDRAFTGANQMFAARCKLYYKNNNPKPQHKRAIEKGDMLLLNQYFGDVTSDPIKLQEYVWFSLCLHFGRRGREGWREMQKDHFVIKSDADNKRYVTTAVTESTKNNPGGHKQSEQDYSDNRMYEVVGATLNPVAALEKYLEKLNPDNPNLFQKPMKCFCFDAEFWYTKEVLGKNTLSNIMKCLSQKAGLKYQYTNHCVRASTVTTLYQAGVDTQQICSITRHRNESTLSHYIASSSDKQKQQASSILTASILDASEITDQELTVDFTKQDVTQHAQNIVATSPSKSAHLMQSVMANTTFNSCTINFYGFSGQSGQ